MKHITTKMGAERLVAISPMLLGDTELAVLNDSWTHATTDVRGTHGRIGVALSITINTVQSTLERLCRKGLLSRAKVGHAYVYCPAVSRQQLLVRLVESTVGRVVGESPAAVLNALVDVAWHIRTTHREQFEALAIARGLPGRADAA